MFGDDARILSLAEYVALLRRHWRLLVLGPLFAALVTSVVAWWLGPEYSASATVLVNPASSPNVEYPNDVVAANMLTRTFSKLVASPPVLKRVITELQLPETLEKLEEKVRVKAEPDTQLIYITTHYRDPRRAVEISNAIGETFVAWMTEVQTSRSTQSSQALKESIDRAKAEIDASSTEVIALRGKPGARTTEEFSRIAVLEAQLEQQRRTHNGLLEIQQRLELAQLAMRHRVAVVAHAEPPERPSSLPGAVLALLALGGSFTLIAVGLVLFERARDRVLFDSDVRRAVGLPVLAAISHTDGQAVIEPATEPNSQSSAAIRALRARLQFATNGRRLGVIAIASPDDAEGKSLLTAQLAVALAQAGHRVILIDGNLAHPRQDKLFGKPNDHGLATLLVNPAASLNDVLVYGDHPGLQLLLTGPPAKGTVDRWATERLKPVIAMARSVADVVLIDLPPLAQASDSLPLAAAADHALIAAEAGRTRSDALGDAVLSIRTTGVDVLGVVLLGLEQNPVAHRR
jgi:capsular exopolysaccharide synthesis family protein